MRNILEIRDLQVHYGGIEAVRGISLDVPEGEIVTLIGANGAGKSSTLRAIAGLVKPSAGKISFLDEDITGMDSSMIVSKGITLVPEGRRIFPDMTVLENLKIGAYLRKDDLTEDLNWVFDLFPRLKERSWQAGGTLSGGEQSRLRLCMLMDEKINLLILDEPTNHLDIASREWVEAAIEEFEGVLLFVSHDRYFIEKFAERIWLLEDGKIRDFPCGYQKYRSILEHEAAAKPAVSAAPKPKKERAKGGTKDAEKLVRRLEREIEKQEQVVADFDRQIEAASADYQELTRLLGEKEEAEAALMDLMEQWEQVQT